MSEASLKSNFSENAFLYASARWTRTIAYYLVFSLIGISSAIVGPTLLDLSHQAHTSLSGISLVFTARLLGLLVGSLLGGYLFDRFSGHVVMSCALGFLAITMASPPLASHLLVMNVVFLTLGISQGVLLVGCNSLIVWLHREKSGPYLNGLHFSIGAGSSLAPLLVAWVCLSLGTFTWSYWSIALLVIPLMIWVPNMSAPQSPSQTNNHDSKRNNALFTMLVIVFIGIYAGAELSFAGWICTYTERLWPESGKLGAYLTSAFYIALTIGRLVSIPLSVRVKPTIVLWYDLFGCMCGIASILLFNNSIPILWFGTILTGFSIASIFTSTLLFAGKHLDITGNLMGRIHAGLSAGGMLLPWIVGQLFDTAGPSILLYVILVDLCCAFILITIMTLFVRRVSSSSISISPITQ